MEYSDFPQERGGGKRKLILVGLPLLLAILAIGYFKLEGYIIALPDCPFECCGAGFDIYKIKGCEFGYRCENHECIEADSDNDGLKDLKEKELHTDPYNPDTDADSLSDGQEFLTYHT